MNELKTLTVACGIPLIINVRTQILSARLINFNLVEISMIEPSEPSEFRKVTTFKIFDCKIEAGYSWLCILQDRSHLFMKSVIDNSDCVDGSSKY